MKISFEIDFHGLSSTSRPRSHNKGAVVITFTRHKFLLVTVKKWLKSVLNYQSYPTNKTGYPFFWNTRYVMT